MQEEDDLDVDDECKICIHIFLHFKIHRILLKIAIYGKIISSATIPTFVRIERKSARSEFGIGDARGAARRSPKTTQVIN